MTDEEITALDALKFQTLGTGPTATTSTAIMQQEVRVIGIKANHFITTNGTIATTSSFVVPEGTIIKVRIELGQRITAITDGGNGHLTIAY